MISSSKVFIHDPLYQRVTMEVEFDKNTRDKIRTFNDEGYTITDVKMDFFGDGVIIHLEKQISEDESDSMDSNNELYIDEDEKDQKVKTAKKVIYEARINNE